MNNLQKDLTEQVDKIIQDSNNYEVANFKVFDKLGNDISLNLDLERRRDIVYNNMIRKICQTKIYTSPQEQEKHDREIISQMLPKFEQLATIINYEASCGKIDPLKVLEFFNDKDRAIVEKIFGLNTLNFRIFANYNLKNENKKIENLRLENKPQLTSKYYYNYVFDYVDKQKENILQN